VPLLDEAESIEAIDSFMAGLAETDAKAPHIT
jgi:hypothetical protein